MNIALNKRLLKIGLMFPQNACVRTWPHVTKNTNMC